VKPCHSCREPTTTREGSRPMCAVLRLSAKGSPARCSRASRPPATTSPYARPTLARPDVLRLTSVTPAPPESGRFTVKVEAKLWLNGDGFPQVTLYLPEGQTILQVPTKDPHGNAKSSKAYRDVMRALGAEEVK
jgi:hypothetical protein